ncbi:MAG TPA: glutamate 5-kinase [Verrucomicrobiae bacterium]|jgi:glutamate 5-kinase|nr:glutamate 5-kinase [Verrucomicrobiae bacterium]
MSERIKKSRRIVIKAGTSILTGKDGSFAPENMARLGNEIVSLIEEGKEVVLVSSGAIGLGMEIASFKKRPKEMAKLQACAAIGQGKLMHAYELFFSKRGIHTAQILLTRDGLEIRERFLRASDTVEELLKMKVLPIVNENDTIATDEIAFGDNDKLSVHVAHLVRADLLIILSDVDGFYLKDGSRVRRVNSRGEIQNELVKHLKDTKKEKTVGGMAAKLKAASTAMELGIPLLIVNGHEKAVLSRALDGDDVGTLFMPAKDRRNAREMWLSFSAPRQGTLVVDAGAHEALRQRKVSLLPRGLVKVRGDFGRGAVVELETPDAKVFGRGVVRYSSDELGRLIGKKSGEIEAVLGYKYQDEIVHRNDMVLWD